MATNAAATIVRVIGIHGVGYATSGAVRSAIAANLGVSSADVEISEVFWSDVLDPSSKTDDSLDSHAISRFARSVLVAASRDFQYSGFGVKFSNPLQLLIQLVDTLSYIVLVALSLLGSVVVLTVVYLAFCFGFGYWQYTSVALRLIPFYWVLVTLILATVTIVTGFVIQLSIGGYSRLEMMHVALNIALRRAILTLLGPTLALPLGVDSGEWLTFVGGFLAFFFLVSVIAGPGISFAMTTYLQHAGASADELTRVPGGRLLFFHSLYLVGVGIALVIASFVWHRAVRPIAKIISDVLVYVGDFRYQQRLLSLATDQLQASMTSVRSIVLYGHSLGSVIAFDALRKLTSKSKLDARVILITAGSPLYHLLWRFFPRQYPLPSVASKSLCSMIPGFFWLNVFRPLDPIGTKLHFERSPRFKDVSTRQYFISKYLKGNILVQHLNYFGDASVATIVSDFARECLTADADADQCSETSAHRATVGLTSHLNRRWLNRISFVSWGIGTMLCAFVAFIEQPKMMARYEVHDVAEVLKRAVSTTGELEVREATNLRVPWSGRPLGHVDYFPQVTFTLPDSNAIIRAEPLNCDQRRAFEWSAAAGPPVKRPLNVRLASRSNVSIIYDRDHPDRCFIPPLLTGTWTGHDRGAEETWLFIGLLALWTNFLWLSAGLRKLRDIGPTKPRAGKRNAMRGWKRTNQRSH